MGHTVYTSTDFQTGLSAISDWVSNREVCSAFKILFGIKSQQVFQKVWNYSLIIAFLNTYALYLHFPHHWSL